jgi:hypothetical protein
MVMMIKPVSSQAMVFLLFMRRPSISESIPSGGSANPDRKPPGVARNDKDSPAGLSMGAPFARAALLDYTRIPRFQGDRSGGQDVIETCPRMSSDRERTLMDLGRYVLAAAGGAVPDEHS